MQQTRIRFATITALAALSIGISTPAGAQSRLSLADRVARLEAQSQGTGQAQSQIELLNRIEQLQSEVQSLRNTVEQQQFEIETLKRNARERQLELDARITRLEGGTATVPPAGGASFAPPPPAPAPGELVAEPVLDNLPPATPPGAGFAEIPTPTAPVPSAGDEKAMYDQAFGALRDGRYAESARLFRAFLDAHPDGELAPNALYWLGESYYVTQNFQIALDTFEELLRRFPQSPKAQDALLKVGYCHYELKQWPEAERALNEVVRRYPDTTVARLAQGRLRALRLDAQRR